MYTALSKSRQFETVEKVEITLPVRLAYDTLIKSAFTENEVLTLYTAVRIGMSATSSTDPIYALCLDAQAIISRVFNQLTQQGVRLELNAQERDLILNVVEIYEILVDNITPQQMLKIITNVETQIRDMTTI